MRTTSGRRVAVVLLAMVAGWLARGIVAWLLFAPSDRQALWTYVLEPSVLLELAVGVALALAVLVVVERRGLFRSDRWWHAGWFVAADLLAVLLVWGPTEGDAVWVIALVSTFTGPWLALLVVGCLAWRRLAPLGVPTAWTDPPDPEDVQR